MKIFCFLTVRLNSSRLKKKCLLKFGKINVLEHNILRSLKGNICPIVCTSLNKPDSMIEKISKKYKVKCFRGSSKDKIKRWYDCAKKNKISFFHTIDVDDPFFDPFMIKKSILKCMKNIKNFRADLFSIFFMFGRSCFQGKVPEKKIPFLFFKSAAAVAAAAAHII